MTTDYITHDEAMINDFIEHPDYANELLNTILTDGDDYEIQRVRTWYNEAKRRTQEASYWNSLINNAEHTAQSGYNLDNVIAIVTKALGILKAATQVNSIN